MRPAASALTTRMDRQSLLSDCSPHRSSGQHRYHVPGCPSTFVTESREAGPDLVRREPVAPGTCTVRWSVTSCAWLASSKRTTVSRACAVRGRQLLATARSSRQPIRTVIICLACRAIIAPRHGACSGVVAARFLYTAGFGVHFADPVRAQLTPGEFRFDAHSACSTTSHRRQSDMPTRSARCWDWLRCGRRSRAIRVLHVSASVPRRSFPLPRRGHWAGPARLRRPPPRAAPGLALTSRGVA